tara:strand:+ start:12997 stop:13329 length:333 start_codon:yes stop_codon:yes gene_type:complete
MWGNLWLSFLAFLKAVTKAEVIIKFLKEKTITYALKTLLKSSTGFTGWLVAYVAENLFEEFAEPLIKKAVRGVGYIYLKVEGKVIIKKLEQAQGNNDEDAYDSAMDDLLK